MRRHPRAFTLVELLIVLAIIALAMSMIFIYAGKKDKRQLQVRSEAEQLASVLRQARALAMDQKAMYGVSFNIANAPGSSGRVLNNRSGGHWYRMIGPAWNNAQMDYSGTGNAYNGPYRYDREHSYWGLEWHDFVFHWATDQLNVDMVGPKYVLPKGLVRFLALADEDNGNLRDPNWHFGDTYPRPWFGEWDSGTKRLYTWGGYDPEIQDFDQPFGGESYRGPIYWGAHQGPAGTASLTGFFYEGREGTITGCVNPQDRYLLENTNGNGAYPGGDKTALLFKQGESRPLVNASWGDAVIYFYPDGHAQYDDWFRLRHEFAKECRYYEQWRVFSWVKGNLFDWAPIDMCNCWCIWDVGGVPYNMRFEASHYVDRTGYWYITLAPDADDDRSTFETARAALATMMPCWRVGVSPLGDIKVIEVKPRMKPGAVLDDVAKDGFWTLHQIGDGTTCNYYNNLLNTTAGGAMPAEDFVTPEMLEHRQWWLKPTP